MSNITEESIQAANRTLLESMNIYDATTYSTQEIRNQLVTKMLPEILKMDMSVDKTTDPDLYASQSRMFAEFRQLLNDRDTADRNNVNIKMKQKDSETAAAQAFNVAEFLSKVKFSGGVPTSGTLPLSASEANELLEQQFEASGCVVLDTELEIGQTPLPEKIDHDSL